MRNRKQNVWLGIAALSVAAAAFLAGRAFAGGIPSTAALTYSGTLEDAAGAPLTGNHNIQVIFWSAASNGTNACPQTTSTSIGLDAGRFVYPLPDTCTAAVKASPNLWAEVLVDGASLGRTKIGAVPYAVEANHAVNADSATTAPKVLRPTPFFKWTTVTVAATDTETFPTEGVQTLTFPDAGYYRVTLNVQSIHDTISTATVLWYLAGTATRLDSFALEAGGKNIQFVQAPPEGRLVESTDVFVSATAGQTLTVKPSLTVSYTSGAFHEANFMYAAEYLGPP